MPEEFDDSEDEEGSGEDENGEWLLFLPNQGRLLRDQEPEHG